MDYNKIKNIELCSHSIPARPAFILPDDNVSKDTESRWLLDICENLVHKHLFGTGEIDALVQKTDNLKGALDGPFPCRQEGCDKVYVQHSRRVK